MLIDNIPAQKFSFQRNSFSKSSYLKSTFDMSRYSTSKKFTTSIHEKQSNFSILVRPPKLVSFLFMETFSQFFLFLSYFTSYALKPVPSTNETIFFLDRGSKIQLELSLSCLKYRMKHRYDQ